MAQNPEYKTIIKCRPLLVQTLALNLSAIADKLCAASLISSSVCKDMGTLGTSNECKAGQLVDNVLHQIELKSTRFDEFIDILNNDSSHSSIVDLLESTLKAEFHDQDKPARRRPSSLTDDASEGLSSGHCTGRMRLCSQRTTSSSLSMEQHEGGAIRLDLLPPSNGAGVKPGFREVLEAIEEVSDWRTLGTHLGIKSSKLDEIARYPPEEQKSQLVAAWERSGTDCTWKKLEEALEKPSVCGVRAVKKARRMSMTPFKDSSIEIDGLRPSAKRENLLPFTEANVLDAVIKISNYHELGSRLGVPPHKLADIEKSPVEDRRQLFVAALFRYTDCGWDKLNSAIKEVETQEWAARDLQRSSSMTKSTSLESDISFMSSVLTDESAFKLPNKMKKSNTTEINVEYSKLMSTIKKKLKNTELDMDDFYLHIVHIFKPEDIGKLIPEATVIKDVDNVFKVLSKQHLWGFEDVCQLKSIADRFIEGDGRLQEMIRDYKFKLSGYRATTRIIDRIQTGGIKESEDDDDEEYESVASNPAKYNKTYRRNLSAKLFKSADGDKVLLTMKSLEYVQKIWNDLCDEFDISLTAVLDKIEEGCIQVTWLIPPHSATKVLDHISEATEFLRGKFISNILLEDIVIYSESFGVADEKTLDEVQLLLAVLDESLAKTNSILQSYSGDVNAQLVTKRDMTVLMIAAHEGCTEIASALLHKGAELNKQDAGGWSALFHAVSGGHFGVVCLLLEDKEKDKHEAKLALKDTIGFTVLDWALKCGHSEIYNMLKTKVDHHLVTNSKNGDLTSVEQLLQMGANVDATDPNKELWTPLMWSSWRGHLDIVKHLLHFKPNVNATAKKGWTPLILSSREGHCEVMRILLDQGADVDQKTEEGWSSLMMTADFGWIEAGKILLENRANINCLDLKNYTPLAEACQNGKHEFVRMLIEQHDPNLNLDGVPEGSWTPLMLACRRGHLQTAKVLLENGANVDKAKEDSVGPLHIVCFEGYNEVVNYLTRMKVDTDVADCFGVTPLMMTIKEGHLGAFKTLLWNGRANLNLQEKKVLHSAVFFAVQCKQMDMLDLLLRNDRIDLSIRDIGGNTVMDFAERHNHEAFLFMKDKYKAKFEQMGVSTKPPVALAARPQQPLVTHKKLANLVAEMMQGIDIRMGRNPKGEVTASAA